MTTPTKLTVALSGALFLGAIVYVGYANELLRDAIPAQHRAILLIGFIVGAGAVSRMIMEYNYKRNMHKIRQVRSRRKDDV